LISNFYYARLLACSHRWLLVALASLCSGPAVALSPPSTPVEPRYELIDALGTTDVVADIAVDPAGLRPALLYYDTTTAETSTPKPIPLKLARFDRFAWVSSTLALVNRRDLTTPDVRDLRLAIDASGTAHALVIESNGAGSADDALIYFGHDAQGATVREQIDVSGVQQIALMVDGVSEPYVAYIKNTGTLVIRRRDEGSWPEIALTPAPTNASSPSFAPQPTEGVFVGPQLAWMEYPANGTVLRHASVSIASATADTIASNAIAFSLSTPQLVVDRFGNLEVAYVSSIVASAPTVELRRRPFNQPTWQCIDTGCSLPTGALTAGFTLSPHAYVQGALNFRDVSGTSKILRREGAAWVGYALANLASAQGSALDRFGNVYTTGIDRSTHRDLFQVRIGGPWESRGRIPYDSNTLLSQALDVANDALGHPVIYARRSCCAPDPRGGLWLIDEGEDFMERPLPGTFTAEGASIAVAPDGNIHLAIYDSDQRDLMHAEFSRATASGSWTVTRVDTVGDVGASPSMLIGSDGTPMIVYRRRPDLLQLATRDDEGIWRIRGIATGVLDAANPVAVASRDSYIVHAAWFDETALKLRVTTVYGNPLATHRVATDLVPSPVGRVRGRIHDIAMLGDSGLAIAHSDEIPSQSQLAYRYRDYTGQWFDPGSQPLPFGPDQITRISLDPTSMSPGSARMAWIIGGRLRYAEKHLGASPWTNEDLGAIAPAAPMQLGAAGALRITYNEGNGLFMLQRLEALGADNAVTQILGLDGGYGFCSCLLPSIDGPDFGCFHRGITRAATTQSGPHAALSARDVLADMRNLFSSTSAGRYYLQLFAEHAPEIIYLTLSAPALLEQRTRTLSDLLPGMTALVQSPTLGGQYRFKPELIDNARAVLQGWADAGSPALAAAVNNELSRTNNFGQFTGMTFTEWFGALSVGTATQQVFADGFE
jgi:hypothetical protein